MSKGDDDGYVGRVGIRTLPVNASSASEAANLAMDFCGNLAYGFLYAVSQNDCNVIREDSLRRHGSLPAEDSPGEWHVSVIRVGHGDGFREWDSEYLLQSVAFVSPRPNRSAMISQPGIDWQSIAVAIDEAGVIGGAIPEPAVKTVGPRL